MAMRMPVNHPEQRPMCDVVFEIVLNSCGPIIDAAAITRACHGDAHLIRYVRDTLGLYAQLEQVEHIRRDLWLVDPDPISPRAAPMRDEYLRAAVAMRALGPWTVIAGSWALALHGVLDPARHPLRRGLRFALTPRPARPATYAGHGQAQRSQLSASAAPYAAAAARHVTFVRGRPIAAVTRPVTRIGDVEWLDRSGHGAHVLTVSAALVSMLEHPRLSGGHAAVSEAIVPVVMRVGLDELLRTGALRPGLAVRRRLAFALMEALARTTGTTSWFGADPWGIVDDESERWRIAHVLQVGGRSGAPTLLDPHRRASGRRLPWLGVIDNRLAPLRAGRREIAGKSLGVEIGSSPAR